MKRFIPVLLCLCLLLAGCGNKNAEPTTAVTTTAPETTAEVTTQTTASETTPETTEAPGVYRNPFTGEVIDTPVFQAPVAVVINNIRAALPQHGVSQADMIYEIETEGGITRCLAFFTDLSDVGEIGAVRSARTFFNNVAVAYNATLVHCGGSRAALKANYSDDGKAIQDWAHINEMQNSKYFYRNQARLNSNYSKEHTLFTTGEKLMAAVAANGYDKALAQPVNYGLKFADEVSLNGETANTVTIRFLGTKKTTMTYNADTGLYEASQYGKDYVDGNTKKVMSFRNVISLNTRQWKINDGTYARSYYDLIGSGDGYFAEGGKIVPIRWSRASLNEPFQYFYTDGTPVTLGVGTTYVAVVSTKGATTAE